ncbi:PAS domain-containing protein [Pseudemcibacter aquimaris]|uniref:PAS domain-containing protein n=1 Tax=Pseudemcibacter aquimaris TaxID=2857064 RepID=UPI002013A45B|nr:PAS domain-containing protein [Pseudemcibacter aquimaris]MCC3859900.1 PAS domain-containing protein [Pseudemcibacter aquimaris]WDU57232.1 PAS domain-containing protein [Pseudemcibacter aquimaris]
MNSSFYKFEEGNKHSDYHVSNLELNDVQGVKDLKSDAQKIIYEYFQGKTQGMRLARRDDIDPSEIKSYLPSSVIADIVRNEQGEVIDLELRLMGTLVTEFYGELTGKNLSNYGDPDAVSRVMTAVRAFNETRRPLIYTSDHEKGFKSMVVSIFFFPLSTDGENIDQLFCTFEIG